MSESADACCVDDTNDADADAETDVNSVTLATKVYPAAAAANGYPANGVGATTATATDTAAHATEATDASTKAALSAPVGTELCSAAAAALAASDDYAPPASPVAEAGAQRTLVLRVTPMTCAGCQRNVLTSLTAVDGVSGVHVELATETAIIQGDASLSEAAIVAAAAANGKTVVVVAR